MDIVDLHSLKNENIVLVKDYELNEHPIECSEKVREICKQNGCGNYGKSWTCPPYAPPFDQCKKELGRFGKLLLYKFSFPVKDIKDMGEIRKLMKKHQDMVREIRDEANSKGIENLSLPGGACAYCEKCTCPDSPCIHPDKALNSNDAYCLNLAGFVESVGLSFKRNEGEVIFFGLTFHN